MKVCVTGATGFVGSSLIKALLTSTEHQVSAISRRADYDFGDKVQVIYSSDISMVETFSDELEGCDVLIHLAGRAHVMRDNEKDPLAEFRKVNTRGTIDLATKASLAGVKRFIFLSSVKVNGEATQYRSPFNEHSKEAPVDNYGISKFEAELGLSKLGERSGMEICIIRPPLVYGSGVKGNFRYLMRLVSSRLPLPFGSIDNRRSIVSLDNLVDLIIVCINHKNAANQIFFVSDGADISTSNLIMLIAEARGVNARLMSVPIPILLMISQLFKLEPQMQRLTSDLQVDISHVKKQLGWTPKVKIQEMLLKMNDQ